MRPSICFCAIFVTGVMSIGCESTEPTNRLRVDQDDTAAVRGTFTATSGQVIHFRSVETAPSVFEVRFDLGHGEFGTDVDWNTYVADPRAPVGWTMTAADRVAMNELAATIDTDVGNFDPATDNLSRQANLWARHPEGKLVLPQIVADRLRGWTKLCNGTSYTNFTYSLNGTRTEYLKYGPGETSNPCRARCGGGCNSVGTSAWTVDCGRHDRCEQYGGSGVQSGCSDELASASDDYTFAANCGY